MALDLRALPGGDLVEEGLSDLARGIESIPALLVSIGAPRLRRIGLPVPERVIPTAEHRRPARQIGFQRTREDFELSRLEFCALLLSLSPPKSNLPGSKPTPARSS